MGKGIHPGKEEEQIDNLFWLACPPSNNRSNQLRTINNYATQRRISNTKVVSDESVRYAHSRIRLPRDNGRQRIFDDENYELAEKKKMFGSDLLEGRDRFDLGMPGWLVNMIPLKGRSRILSAAGIIGSCFNGTEVKLGQLEIDNNTSSGKKYVTSAIRFTFEEQKRLREFGKECNLFKTPSIIRTAVFIGLSVPNAVEGIINPPWQYIEGWEQGWREDITFDPEFLERILILSGAMDRELFEERGCAVLDALEYYRRTGGIDDLTKQIVLAVGWEHQRIIDTIVDMLDKHKKNVIHAQRLRKNGIDKSIARKKIRRAEQKRSGKLQQIVKGIK